MAIRKQRVGGDDEIEQEVERVCPPPGRRLDQLGELHGVEQREQREPGVRGGGEERGLCEGEEGERVPDQRRVVHPGEVRGPDGERPGPPDVAVDEERDGILAEGRARPALALRGEELEAVWVRAEDGGHSSFLLALHLDLPAVPKDPACDEVVVVGLDGPTAEDVFVREGVLKRVAQDLLADQTRAAGDTEDTAICRVSGLDLEVVADEVEAAHVVPEARVPSKPGVVESAVGRIGGRSEYMLHPFASSDKTYLGVIERGKSFSQPVGRPFCGVVCRDNNSCVGVGNACHDLTTLAGDANINDSDVSNNWHTGEVVTKLIRSRACCILMAESSQEGVHTLRGHLSVGRENNAVRSICQDGRNQVLEGAVISGTDGRNQDCTVHGRKINSDTNQILAPFAAISARQQIA